MVQVSPGMMGVLLALALAALCLMVLGGVAGGLLVALLPLCAALGGYVSGRWTGEPQRAPGLEIGLLLFAAELGLGWGFYHDLFALTSPGLALIQGVAAVTGGLMGMVHARRSTQLQTVGVEA